MIPNYYNNNPFNQKLQSLQQEYQQKLQELQQMNYTQMQQPASAPYPQQPINNIQQPIQQPSVDNSQQFPQPDGAVPPHMQILSAIGSLKGVLNEIRDALVVKSEVVPVSTNEDPKAISENVVIDVKKEEVKPINKTIK